MESSSSVASHELFEPSVRSTAYRVHIRILYEQTLLLLLPLIFLYVYLVNDPEARSFDETTNGVAPLYFILILTFTSYRLVRRCPEAIWSPVFWVPVQSAVFFGFGPLIEVYGSEMARDALQSHALALTQAELLRVHLLSSLGVWLVLLGLWAHVVLRPHQWRESPAVSKERPGPVLSPSTLAVIFILGGLGLRYFILKPAQWGIFQAVIPGAVTALGAIVDVGFGLAALIMARQGSKQGLRVLFWLSWVPHFFLTLLSLSKMEILFAMLLPAIGGFAGDRKVGRLSVWFVAMAIVYTMAQQWVYFGRAAIWQRTNTITQADYSDRLELLAEYLEDPSASLVVEKEETSSWWARLSYAGPQGFAMNLYDTGRPGDSLKDAWIRFVPRIIWPGKPLVVGPGAEFNRLVTGHESTSFLALSVYGDLYWQFGWWGVVLGCPIIGWFFGMMSWRCLVVIRGREFVLIPIVLIALETSVLGLNKYVVNGIVGVVPIYFSYLVIVRYLLAMFKKRRVRYRLAR